VKKLLKKLQAQAHATLSFHSLTRFKRIQQHLLKLVVKDLARQKILKQK